MISVAVEYEPNKLTVDVEGELDATTSTTLFDWLGTIASAAEGRPVVVDLRKARVLSGNALRRVSDRPGFRLLVPAKAS